MQIPTSWRELLASVQAVCPSAVIAGGALRDLDNSRPIKDLDIFVTARVMDTAQDAMVALKRAGFRLIFDATEKTAYPADQNLEVVAVAELGVSVSGGGSTDVPVQVIFVNWDTARIVERFDYGICRLSFDGKSEVVIPPLEYIDDKRNKVFRLRRDRPTPMSMRGSVHRYARLVAEKYQGWTWWPYEADEDWAIAA